MMTRPNTRLHKLQYLRIGLHSRSRCNLRPGDNTKRVCEHTRTADTLDSHLLIGRGAKPVYVHDGIDGCVGGVNGDGATGGGFHEDDADGDEVAGSVGDETDCVEDVLEVGPVGRETVKVGTDTGGDVGVVREVFPSWVCGG